MPDTRPLVSVGKKPVLLEAQFVAPHRTMMEGIGIPLGMESAVTWILPDLM